MKNPCGRFAPDGSNNPIRKGQKTKEKIRSLFGNKNTARKFITGK